ncbi:MAG: hypothetical protein AB1642_10125 [Pseudomonadota bacterium]
MIGWIYINLILAHFFCDQKDGASPHAFMVSAIEQAALAAEQRLRFIAEAKLAKEEMIDTGRGLDADEVHAYLKAKLAEKKVAKPKPRSWRA